MILIVLSFYHLWLNFKSYIFKEAGTIECRINIHVWTNTWAVKPYVTSHTPTFRNPPNHPSTKKKISEITRTWNRHPTLNEQKMRNNSPEIEKASCHLARSFYRTMRSTECTLKKWTVFYWKSLPRYPSPQTWKPLNESRQGKINIDSSI